MSTIDSAHTMRSPVLQGHTLAPVDDTLDFAMTGSIFSVRVNMHHLFTAYYSYMAEIANITYQVKAFCMKHLMYLP